MNPITSLDDSILYWVDAFARKSWLFDHAVSELADNTLLKGGVIVTLLWWAWFRSDQNGAANARDRSHVIATVLASFAALAAGRLLVMTVPFRARPIDDNTLAFIAPYDVHEGLLAKATSFPSDHAVLFFAMAAGLFFISRRLGAWVTVYTVAVIVLPRMYLGLHFFSDIVVGAIVGLLTGCVGNRWLPATRPVQAALHLSVAKPMLFYPFMFLVTFELAELFTGSRAIASMMVKVLR